MNRKRGFICEFDGYQGYIITEDNEKIFFQSKDVIDNNPYHAGDEVEITKDYYETSSEVIPIARFIKLEKTIEKK